MCQPGKQRLMFDWKTELISKIDTEFIEEFFPIDLELEEIMRRFLM